MKSRVTTIEFPVLSDYIVHVELTSDMRKSLDKYPPTKIVPLDDATNAITIHITGDNFSFMFLPYNVSVGTIAHESWHVINRMLDQLGVKLDSEVVGYHLGYMVNRIFRFARGKK